MRCHGPSDESSGWRGRGKEPLIEAERIPRMTTASNISDELRSNVVEALQISLTRATAQELGVTTDATNLRKMQDWLTKASMTPQGIPLAPMPISGEELRALQRAVDQVARRRLAEHEPGSLSASERAYRAAMAAPPASGYARLRRSLFHLMVSSWVAAVPLAALLIADIVALVAIRASSRTIDFALVGNLALVILATAAWGCHQYRLFHHAHHATERHPTNLTQGVCIRSTSGRLKSRRFPLNDRRPQRPPARTAEASADVLPMARRSDNSQALSSP